MFCFALGGLRLHRLHDGAAHGLHGIGVADLCRQGRRTLSFNRRANLCRPATCIVPVAMFPAGHHVWEPVANECEGARVRGEGALALGACQTPRPLANLPPPSIPPPSRQPLAVPWLLYS